MLRNGLLLFVCVILLGSCSFKKYGDVINTLEDSIEIQEDFISDLKKAKSSLDYKDALLDFSTAIVENDAELAELEKKYPELNSAETTPLEIKDLLKKVETSFRETEKQSFELLKPEKVKEFASDPEFVKAMQAFATALHK